MDLSTITLLEGIGIIAICVVVFKIAMAFDRYIFPKKQDLNYRPEDEYWNGRIK